jgi:hypothetical protein
MGRCTRIRMVIDNDDPFLDSYAQELFACHAMIDSMKVSPDNIVTVTLNKELFSRMLRSHIHAIRKL